MKALDEGMKIELVDLFRGIYDADDEIEELKVNIKVFTASKREMIKSAADRLEMKPLHIRKAYKEWVMRIQNQEEAEAIDEVVQFLQEFVTEKI